MNIIFMSQQSGFDNRRAIAQQELENASKVSDRVHGNVQTIKWIIEWTARFDDEAKTHPFLNPMRDVVSSITEQTSIGDVLTKLSIVEPISKKIYDDAVQRRDSVDREIRSALERSRTEIGASLFEIVASSQESLENVVSALTNAFMVIDMLPPSANIQLYRRGFSTVDLYGDTPPFYPFRYAHEHFVIDINGVPCYVVVFAPWLVVEKFATEIHIFVCWTSTRMISQSLGRIGIFDRIEGSTTNLLLDMWHPRVDRFVETAEMLKSYGGCSTE
jgi:hypothetical protein